MNCIEYLPTLIVDKLLSFLDIHDWLKLRLVCKTTKLWIETSKVGRDTSFLQLLDDYKDEPAIIKKQISILKHHWTHSRIYLHFQDYFFEYLTIIGPSLKYLKIQSFSGKPEEIDFLSKCYHLESLSIQTLDLTGKPEISEFEKYELFSPVLKNLEHFDLQRISIHYPPGLELEYFGKLLKLMENLTTLNIPEVVESTHKIIEKSINQSINFGFVIGPIIKYVSRRAHSSLQERDVLYSLNLLQFHPSFYELFPELLKICYKSGTLLINVNYTLIRKLIAMRYDPVLLQVVHSLNNRLVVGGDVKVLSSLRNVQSLNLDCDKCEICIVKEIDIEKLSLFPELKEAEFCVWSDKDKNARTDEDKQKIENLEKILFAKDHSKCKKLTLTCHERNQILFKLTPIWERFKNLTVLKIVTFSQFGDEDFKAILKCLKKLEILEIDDDWGGLTDMGVTAASSDQNESYEIFSLKSLVKLKLKGRCKYTGAFYPQGQSYMWPWTRLQKFSKSPNPNFLSDYSFKEVFRHMRLKSFLVEIADIHITKLGYQYLLQGDFASSVEYFPLPEYLPLGLSQEEFYQLQSEFKHFKQIRQRSESYFQSQYNPHNISSSNYNYPHDFRKESSPTGCIIC